jgi:Ca2+/Na+ antiporter
MNKHFYKILSIFLIIVIILNIGFPFFLNSDYKKGLGNKYLFWVKDPIQKEIEKEVYYIKPSYYNEFRTIDGNLNTINNTILLLSELNSSTYFEAVPFNRNYSIFPKDHSGVYEFNFKRCILDSIIICAVSKFMFNNPKRNYNIIKNYYLQKKDSILLWKYKEGEMAKPIRIILDTSKLKKLFFESGINDKYKLIKAIDTLAPIPYKLYENEIISIIKNSNESKKIFFTYDRNNNCYAIYRHYELPATYGDSIHSEIIKRQNSDSYWSPPIVSGKNDQLYPEELNVLFNKNLAYQLSYNCLLLLIIFFLFSLLCFTSFKNYYKQSIRINKIFKRGYKTISVASIFGSVLFMFFLVILVDIIINKYTNRYIIQDGAVWGNFFDKNIINQFRLSSITGLSLLKDIFQHNINIQILQIIALILMTVIWVKAGRFFLLVITGFFLIIMLSLVTTLYKFDLDNYDIFMLLGNLGLLAFFLFLIKSPKESQDKEKERIAIENNFSRSQVHVITNYHAVLAKNQSIIIRENNKTKKDDLIQMQSITLNILAKINKIRKDYETENRKDILQVSLINMVKSCYILAVFSRHDHFIKIPIGSKLIENINDNIIDDDVIYPVFKDEIFNAVKEIVRIKFDINEKHSIDLLLKPKEIYNLYYAMFEIFFNCIKHSDSNIYIEINMPQIIIIGADHDIQKPINVKEYFKHSNYIHKGQGLTLINNALQEGIKSYKVDYYFGMKSEDFIKSFLNLLTIK